MAHESDQRTEPTRSMVYQIRIKGHLGPEWSNWFEGMTVTRERDGETLVTGPIVDQAALHGLLKKIRDLGLPLISVSRLGGERGPQADGDC